MRPVRLLSQSPPVVPSPVLQDRHGLIAPDIAFLIGHGVAQAALAAATERARMLNVPAHRCLIAAGLVSETTYALWVGQRLAAPVVKRAAIDGRVTLRQALAQGWCRARLGDGKPVVLTRLDSPVTMALLTRLPAASDGHLAIAADSDFTAILCDHFRDDVAAFAATTVPAEHSARTALDIRQKWALLLLAMAIVPMLVLAPWLVGTLLPLLLSQFFVASTIVQLAACVVGFVDFRARPERDDARLPSYSVLVPLYREAAIVGDLVAALHRLDYPVEKMQVLLVVEEGDRETQVAIRALDLPPHIRMFVAPPGLPRTKPRAINAAMPFITGEIVVVYDAEDRPDPLQLRAAAARFQKVGRDVACLQARLAIDHCDDSWLTRLFFIEYAALFDVVKFGQAQMGLPVPLGGTSNHFRAAVLREAGFWDAWNVTEDADLGIRLATRGYRVEDLASTTGEEAPVNLSAWMHQRSRWLKGWMQTVITHSRRPLETARRMGAVNFGSAAAVSLGVVVGIAFAPIFMVMAAVRIGSDNFLVYTSLLDVVSDALILVLGSAGVLATFAPAVIGLIKRRRLDLLPWLILLPVYHLMMSVASWRAFYELVRTPHAWNKTTHGVARASRPGGG